MNLPKKTGVNFVENLDIVQQFEQLPDSNWVLTDDDMTVERTLRERYPRPRKCNGPPNTATINSRK